MGRSGRRHGFTLIELSIVLVIIGLLVGGVLVGQDLIRSAGERAQITQIERYNMAVNTFRTKFNAIPGDMDPATSTRFGFSSRTGVQGNGDGNGLIESYANYLVPAGLAQGYGEPELFWNDLSYANGLSINLIDQVIRATSINGLDIGPSTVNAYLPSAAIGAGNILYAYSFNGSNYFGLSSLSGGSSSHMSSLGPFFSNPGLTVRQAFDVDKKIDDGFPLTGNITATYDNAMGGFSTTPLYAAGGTSYNYVWGPFGAPPGTGAIPSSTTCYDNGGNASTPMAYSVGFQNGNNANCALSFKFQ